MSVQRGGILFCRINGVAVAVKGSVTYKLGTEVNEPVIGLDTVHGYKTTPAAPELNMTISDAQDVDVKALQSIKGGTLLLGLKNGKNVVFGDAVCKGDGEVNPEEGEVVLNFFSTTAQEF